MTDKAHIEVRCRHALGDIVLGGISEAACVQTVKELLLTKWPTGLAIPFRYATALHYSLKPSAMHTAIFHDA